MQLPLFQVDAFATTPFRGNPAAVMPLEAPLSGDLMSALAQENNLSETAFLWPVPQAPDTYHLCWFTPTLEVDLCGHATLAAAHTLWTELGFTGEVLHFMTRSGPLSVRRVADSYELDFPAIAIDSDPRLEQAAQALGATPTALFRARDGTPEPHYLLAHFATEAAVQALAPDMTALKRLAAGCLIATAASQAPLDFISRFFAPGAGVDEDPVTGSAHCVLAPFWASRLNKTTLQARQISQRGGDLACEVRGTRVLIQGSAVTVLRGTFSLPD